MYPNLARESRREIFTGNDRFPSFALKLFHLGVVTCTERADKSPLTAVPLMLLNAIKEAINLSFIENAFALLAYSNVSDSLKT